VTPKPSGARSGGGTPPECPPVAPRRATHPRTAADLVPLGSTIAHKFYAVSTLRQTPRVMRRCPEGDGYGGKAPDCR
jgi:hypothetical protein